MLISLYVHLIEKLQTISRDVGLRFGDNLKGRGHWEEIEFMRRSFPGDSGEVCGKTVSQSESRKHAEFCRPSSPDPAFENVRDLTKSQLRVVDVSSINDLFA